MTHRWPVAALVLTLGVVSACSGGGPRRAVPPASRPTATASTGASSAACVDEHGALSYRSVPTRGGAVRVAVYLPPCALAVRGARYPTIYLLHGAGTDETQWPAIGLAATADRLIVHHEIAPVIVVMPSSGLDPGDSSVQDDVVPWADANLPTSATKADRVIGGISRGGRAALRIVAAHPALFSRLGGHSLTVPDDPAVLAQLARWGGAVWLDVGDADTLRSSTEGMARTLQSEGLRPELHVWPGGHNRPYWGSHVADYLRFYAAAWKIPSVGGA